MNKWINQAEKTGNYIAVKFTNLQNSANGLAALLIFEYAMF